MAYFMDNMALTMSKIIKMTIKFDKFLFSATITPDWVVEEVT